MCIFEYFSEGYTKKAKQEISNLIETYSLLDSIKPSNEPFILEESLIRDLHKIITNEIPDEHNIPGQYRNGVFNINC